MKTILKTCLNKLRTLCLHRKLISWSDEMKYGWKIEIRKNRAKSQMKQKSRVHHVRFLWCLAMCLCLCFGNLIFNLDDSRFVMCFVIYEAVIDNLCLDGSWLDFFISYFRFHFILSKIIWEICLFCVKLFSRHSWNFQTLQSRFTISMTNIHILMSQFVLLLLWNVTSLKCTRCL